MDIPNITMWDFGLENNTPMIVTPDGKSITPSLTNFKSDRIPNKNSDLNIESDTVELGKGNPISIIPNKNLY